VLGVICSADMGSIPIASTSLRSSELRLAIAKKSGVYPELVEGSGYRQKILKNLERKISRFFFDFL